MVHETKLTSEISWPADSCLAQLVDHERDDQAVGSNPIGAIFNEKFILFYVTLDLSDSLTEMHQISYHEKPE